jgi:hypothetical protein
LICWLVIIVLALYINHDLLAALGIDDIVYLILTERKISNFRALLSISKYKYIELYNSANI